MSLQFFTKQGLLVRTRLDSRLQAAECILPPRVGASAIPQIALQAVAAEQMEGREIVADFDIQKMKPKMYIEYRDWLLSQRMVTVAATIMKSVKAFHSLCW